MGMSGPMSVAAEPRTRIDARWLGRLDYHDAWALQHDLVEKRANGTIPDQLLLLEHPAVLTLGRQSDPAHIRASTAELKRRGIEVVRVERGGEVTYHGPGQLVAYPIIHLTERQILLRPFVRALEQAMIDTAATFKVSADRREGYPGIWCATHTNAPRKLGALGLRVERGVSYHGIALNITTDLGDFELIDPCGLPDASVTSIAREAGWPANESVPSTASVQSAALVFERVFGRALGMAVTAAAS
jgi:lipoyl(octanoyl) transferase